MARPRRPINTPDPDPPKPGKAPAKPAARPRKAPASTAPRKAPARPQRPRRPGPAEGGGKPAWMRPAVVAVAVTAAVLLALGAELARWLATAHAGRGQRVRVTLRAEDDAAQVTRALWEAGVVDRPWLFHPLAALTGAAARARRGTVALRDDLTPWAVLRALRSGRAGLVRVTFPEGFTRFDMARRLEHAEVCAAEAFLAATEQPAVLARHGVPTEAGSVEGLLFPETYDLPIGSEAEAVVDRMVAVFHRRVQALLAARPEALPAAGALVQETAPGARADGAALDPTLWAVVTLASLVERETGHPDDRAHVAGVFWNRLTRPDFRPRLLQSDPTVRYGCLVRARRGEPAGPCAAPDGTLRRVPNTAMLADAANRWNTYRHEHLPPSPIANPGAAALRAALSPLPCDDLYFVAGPDGRSTFAATLADHHRNVRAWRATQGPAAPPATIPPRDGGDALP